jgi:hypothetical protein
MTSQGAGTALDGPRRTRHGRRGSSPDRSSRRPAGALGETGGGRHRTDPSAAPPSRQSRRRRAERKRFWLVTMPALVAVTALTVLVGKALRDDDGPQARTSPGAQAAAAAPTRAVTLLAHRGADGRADLLAVAGSNGDDTSLVFVPTATQVEVPSLGLQTLAVLPQLGDASLLGTTVENVLGVRLSDVTILDDASLDALLAPAAPLDVVFRSPVQFAGEVDPAFDTGSHRLSAADARRVLAARQAGSELDRFVAAQAVLQSWFAAARQAKVATAVAATSPVGATLAGLAASGSVHFDTLPVRSLASGSEERFDVRRGETDDLLKSSYPDALLGGGAARPRVEILNGTGAVGVAQAVARKIVPAGGQVTLTGNVPGFDVVQTQVVYYRDRDRAAAQRLLDALGKGTLKRSSEPLDVVDVTIMVGADLAPVEGG